MQHSGPQTVSTKTGARLRGKQPQEVRPGKSGPACDLDGGLRPPRLRPDRLDRRCDSWMDCTNLGACSAVEQSNRVGRSVAAQADQVGFGTMIEAESGLCAFHPLATLTRTSRTRVEVGEHHQPLDRNDLVHRSRWNENASRRVVLAIWTPQNEAGIDAEGKAVDARRVWRQFERGPEIDGVPAGHPNSGRLESGRRFRKWRPRHGSDHKASTEHVCGSAEPSGVQTSGTCQLQRSQ